VSAFSFGEGGLREKGKRNLSPNSNECATSSKEGERDVKMGSMSAERPCCRRVKREMDRRIRGRGPGEAYFSGMDCRHLDEKSQDNGREIRQERERREADIESRVLKSLSRRRRAWKASKSESRRGKDAGRSADDATRHKTNC